MPITSSAKKALRQTHTKTSRNKRFKALWKESVKAFERAVAAGSKKEATELLSKVYSNIDKLQKKNVIHKNNASRKKAKYAKALKTAFVK